MEDLEDMLRMVNEANDVQTMAESFRLIREKLTRKALEIIEINKIIRILENTEDIGGIAFLLEESTLPASRPVKRRILTTINLKGVGRKIEQEIGAGSSILLFKQFPDELKAELIKTINYENMIENINSEPSVWATGILIKLMRKADVIIGRKIVRELDLDGLHEKISKALEGGKIEGIRICLREIMKTDYLTWKELVKKIPLPSLVKRLERTNITEITEMLEILLREEGIQEEIRRHLNFDKLARRINEGADTLSLIHLLERVCELGSGGKLIKKVNLEKLAQKINEESKNFKNYTYKALEGHKEAESLVKMIKV